MWKRIIETPKTLKNGKKIIIEEDEYEFFPEIWDIIKEYAGIYSFNIKWDKLKMAKYPHFFKAIVNFGFSNDPDGAPMPDCRFKKCPESIIRRQFWDKVNSGHFKPLPTYRQQELGMTAYNKKWVIERIHQEFGVWTLPKEFQVGDEIQFYACEYANDQTKRAGRIVSIAKDRTSYKIAEYKYGEKKLDSRYNNDYDRHFIYEWDKTSPKETTIKSHKTGMEKGLENPTYTLYYN